MVLADDSGLEVDALEGRPGVYSARFAGEGADDSANNRKLLKEMDGVPTEQRTARFRCVMVVAENGAERANFAGEVAGRILEEQKGEAGFGYDPLFIPDGHGHSFAELGPDVKNQISHRARALQELVAWLTKEQ